MTNEKENLQDLIEENTRRLDHLKQKKARMGINTPVEILTEIEDIEKILLELKTDLSKYQSPNETKHPESPVVHIHCWKPANIPPDALDWSAPGKFVEYDDRTRTLPSPETWDEMLQSLRNLRRDTCDEGWVRLEGRCGLSAGFAFGHVFHSKDRYQIEVAQYIGQQGGVEYWASNTPPPKRVSIPQFAPLPVTSTAVAAQSPTKDDGIIVVAALKNKSAAGILADVGTYFGEREAFRQIPQDNLEIQAVKGVLLLEAKEMTQGDRLLAGWEVASLASSSVRLVNDFVQTLEPKRLHMFLAAPLGLAVFLGHFWLHVNKTVQLYEEVRTESFYAPLGLMKLR